MVSEPTGLRMTTERLARGLEVLPLMQLWWFVEGDGQSEAIELLRDLLHDHALLLEVARAAAATWEDYDGQETWAEAENMKALAAALRACGPLPEEVAK